MPQLTVWYNGSETTVTDGAIIGAANDATVRIAMPGISRHHARIVFSDGTWFLEDTASTNGTFAAGQRIERVPVDAPIDIRLGHPTEGEMLHLDPGSSTIRIPGGEAAGTPGTSAVAPAHPDDVGLRVATLERLLLATWVMTAVLAVLVAVVVFAAVLD